ncbi:hypothetical protein CSQ96_01355 [Janthinobacterium sp. BJB412]|nr:hypothetical protein CSQ96_01355 [Janthinobacterium sp. BJB412]
MIVSTLGGVAAAALAAGAALADPPARVGRISSLEGQVTVLAEGEANAALLNWPITSDNHIATGRGARAEFRVGAAALRLDGDSDLEISQLDDDSLRLYLHYGSVSVRIRDNELARDFELSTPQARVTLGEPGWLRVDAGRSADTSVVSVFAGTAQVDGAGNTVSLRGGHRVEVGNEELHTGTARRDAFDNWAEARDRREQAGAASRYLPSEVTGYEELDQYGSWQDSSDYGPLWTPRVVAVDWAPYRDGRWVWLAPWGWTWVDNAPWGYAPSHYGRWVMVNRRWCWAPGRVVGRPVWAPALVGWVGGDQLTVTFGGSVGRRHAPGTGWFPLSPRDTYVPPYRVSVDQERRLSWRHDGRGGEWRDGRGPGEARRDHRDGVTVLPRDQFDGHRVVPVGKGPKVIMTQPLMVNAPLVSAPAAPARVLDTRRLERRDDGRGPGRGERADHADRAERNTAPGRPERLVLPLRTQAPPQQLTQQLTQPQQQPPQQPSPARPPGNRVIEIRHEPRPGPAVLVAPAAPVVMEDRVLPRNKRPPRGDEENRRGRNHGQDAEPAQRAPGRPLPAAAGQAVQPAQPAQPPAPHPAVPQQQAQQVHQPQPVLAPLQRPAPQPQAQQVHQPQPVQPPVPRPAPQVQQQAPQPAPAAAGRDAGRPGNEAPGRKEGHDRRREEGRDAR